MKEEEDVEREEEQEEENTGELFCVLFLTLLAKTWLVFRNKYDICNYFRVCIGW